MAIAFNPAGTFGGVVGGPSVLSNPTSLQFGPDGRLYVAEQNGSINAFTVSIENGEYAATAHEELLLPDGGGVVKSIQNHNDDGTDAGQSNRQVTGLVVTGTAASPVLYISSSDPRISSNNDLGLDTNSGVITRVTWTGSEWEAVDIVRGLPRSEENHSNNGLAIDPTDPTKLYVMVGGNTNNGAPSGFFSYTGEYALSGTLLEIDLADIESRPILTDPAGGQNGASRQYVYDLPTLDDPNVPNTDDGVGEDANGLDEDGPWGGNDGLNMAILPADAPLRIFADGFRNAYDIAFTPDGRLYTVDNGSNGNLGADPNTESGDLDGDGVANEAINTPANGGSGDPEPLFFIEEGGYYGHPAPARSNQNQSWTAYDNSGNPDGSLAQNTVGDLSAQVPTGVNIADGFIIDPSKFAGVADLAGSARDDRLLESGIRVERDSAASNAIITTGSSTNGIVVYDSGGQAFDGYLDGKLFVTQFNDNVTLLNLNATGDGLDPVPTPGADGLFGTADDGVEDADGIYFVANNSLGVPLGNPLDVTVGPNGTLWVAEIGSNEVTVLAPSDVILPGDNDSDDDGLLNAVDPFLRDATNGTSVTIAPGTPTVWEFSQDAGDVTPGPDGFGGGLTGVMIDGTTDFEAFLQSDSDRDGQVIQLDNVKFVTAAGGGTTVIEEVTEGDPFQTPNDGQFLFHTGFQVARNVDTFTVQWVVANPGAITGGSDITNNFQQIGGYLGDGTQSNYLKIVAIATNNDASQADVQVLLEDGDGVLQQINLPANDIFNNAVLVQDSAITFELEIDPAAATATPKATFVTTSGDVEVTGTDVIDLTGSKVLEAILGNVTVQGQSTGLAAGLFASNFGSPDDTFQAVFDSITVTATEAQVPPDAVDDTAFTGVNAVLNIPVSQLLANDTDANPSDTLTVTSVGNAQNGTVALNADVVTFTPATDFAGTAFFEYTISDGTFEDSATVEVSVADRVILYRVNAGGNEIAAIDSGPAWAADTSGTPNANLLVAGSNSTASFNVQPGTDVPDSVPAGIYQTERWDNPNAPEMQYGFAVDPGQYEVNLLVGNGFDGTSQPGERVYDVAIEGTVLQNLNDIDLSSQFGHLTGSILSNTVEVTDGTLNIEFLHGVENPLVNGIEIVQVGTTVSPAKPEVNILSAVQTVPETGQAFVSIATDIPVPNDETVDVNFTIEPIGGATPGTGGDYTYNSASASFGGGTYTDTKSIAGGSVDLQIPVSILEDMDIDPGEGFVLTINSVSANATLGANSVATVNIDDDDVVVNPGDVLFRINAGGPEVAATDGGPAWSGDQGDVANGAAVAGPASPYLVDRGIDGTTTATSDNVTYGDATPVGPGVNDTGAPDALFTTERFSAQANPDNIGYAFAVPNGNYLVNLYFDEIFFTAAGERVFDVALEGALVLDDFDTFATYGNDTGVESFTTTVSDGELNLEFLKTAINNPHVAAIEIVAAEGTVYAPPADDLFGTSVEIGDTGTAPSGPVLLSPGDNVMSATQEGENDGANGVRDRDYFTVTIPQGYQLTGIELQNYANANGAAPDAFFAFEEGDQLTVDPVTGDGVENLLGAIIYGSGNVGADLLATMRTGFDDPATGNSLPGFDQALSGDYTFWMNQGAGPSTATLNFVVEALPAEPGAVVAAVNAGGPALTQDGIDFAADQHFLGGTAFTDGASVDVNSGNGEQPAFDGTVYETERFGNVAYEIPVTPGNYTVELHFAEIFQSDPGARVFDVSIEGTLVLDDYDILAANGGDIDQPIVFDVPGNIAPDTFDNPNAIDIDFSTVADNAKISAIVIREATPPAPSGGAATLAVNDGSNDIQVSNFGNGSFVLTNTGTKDIASVVVDVTNALYPDAVFDPLGEAGDTIGKQMTISGGSATGVTEPASGYYIGAGGVQGFEQIQLDFDPAVDGGFNPGESVAFAVDMDPNSIAGAVKSTLDSGADPTWDIGGIGGAELIGSSFTLTFTDGTTATGQLRGQTNASGDALQGGSDGLASQDSPGEVASLTVNGLADGQAGTYAEGGPTVLVNGPIGATVRVTMTKGIIQPVTNEFFNGDADDQAYAPQLDDQLAALAASGFPANNAAFFQTVDVEITEANQDISSLFNFTDVPGIDLAPRDEAQLPLGFVASVIDPANGNAPLGPVSSPIHLTFAENVAPTIDPIADITIDEGAAATFTVSASDLEDDTIVLSVEVLRDADGTVVDPSTYSFTDNGDGTGNFAWTTGEPDDGAYTVTVTADDGTTQRTETLALVVNEVADPQPGTVLYRVNAGGAEATATDSGPVWTADTQQANSPFLVNPGSNNDFPTNGLPNTSVDMSMLADTGAPVEVLGIERWDNTNDANGEMAWAFDVAAGTEVEVRLYLAELFTGLSDLDGSGDPTGDRIFDVNVDGVIPAAFDNLDPYSLAGNAFNKGVVVSHTLVSDGTVDLEFIHVSENPAIKGIEIVVAGAPDTAGPTATLAPPAAPVPGSASLEFPIEFADDSGIDVSTLDDTDVTVTNTALGFSASATLVSVDVPADGSPRTATYAVAAPGGTWDAADNGTYEIALADGEVADLNGNTAAASPLGTFEVDLSPAAASALIEVTPDAGLGGSTFGGSSFQVTNTSEAGVQITSVVFDLSSGILPDMVFDPTGSGGDATSNPLTANSGAGATGFVAPLDPALDPFSQPRNGGFDILTVDFSDFDPSEQFFFTTDVDPNSIQSVPGAGAAGAVSGYELVGSTVTVTFSNGETLVGSLFEDGSLGGAQVVLDSEFSSTAPTIEMVGAGPDESTLPGTQVTVGGADHVVRVTGTPGEHVALLQMDARLFIASGDAPFDVAADELPFYANESMAGKVVHTGVIPAAGFVDIPITLLATDGGATPDGGLNHFVAVTSPTPYAVDQATSRTSETLVVRQGAPVVFDAPGTERFDGTDSTVIELPHDPAWEIASGTVAFSFNAADTSGAQGLVTKDASGFAGGGNHFVMYLQGSTLIARFQDGASSAELEFAGMQGGTEYEIAATFGPDGVGLWVDGNLVDTASLVMDWSNGGNTEYLQWGGRGWASSTGAPGFDAPFEGTIADRQIYDAELTASEIAALAASSSGTNAPPAAEDDAALTDEDTAVNIDPAANDFDPDGDAVTVSAIASAPANGTAVVEPDGTVTYTPDPDFNGTDGFFVTVTDAVGGFAESEVTVTVEAVNDDPVAVDDTGNTTVDNALTIDALANDLDVDGDTLQITAVTDGSNGTVENNGDGTVTYTPGAGFTGSDSFTYTIGDGAGGAPSTATVTVAVLAGPNTPPVATDDAFFGDEDTVISGGVLANDEDPDGDDAALTAALVSGPANGTLVFNPDGTFDYTPDADFNGPDSFSYVADDGVDQSAPATVTLTVTPVNDAPVANDDAASGGQGQAIIIDLLANDTDVDGDTLSIASLDTPGAGGTLTDNGNGTVTYTSAAGFDGTDTFTYVANDGTADSAPATVSVDVSAFPTPFFDSPGQVAFDGSSSAVIELPHDPLYEIAAGTVAFAFTAVDTSGAQGLFVKDASGFVGGGNHFAMYLQGSTLVARFQDGSSSATLEVSGIIPAVEYDVAATFDGSGGKLFLDGVEVASTPLVMDWSGGGNVEYIQWGGRGWASASGQPGFDAPFEGTISNRQVYDFALTADQVGTLQGDGPPNADPVAVDDIVTTAEDTAVSFDPTDNDSDADDDPLKAAFVVPGEGAANGTVSIDAGGTVTYTPDANFFGADAFTLAIEDGRGGVDTSVVEVTVTSVEDAPVALNDTAEVQVGEQVVIDVLANDTDGDGDLLTVQAAGAGASFGTVAINTDGTLTYTSDGTFGEDTFTYEISDGDQTTTATVTVTVTEAPTLPDPVFSQGGVSAYSGSSADVANYTPSDALKIAEGTIAFSFIDANPSVRQGLVVKDASGFVGGGNHFAAYIDGGDLLVRFQDGDSETTLSFDDLVAGQEYEVAATFGASGVALFVDGNNVGSDNLVMNWTTNVEWLQVGGLGWGSASGDDAFTNPFSGEIADVAIYDDVLDQELITQLANGSSFDLI
jgi:hypothetical protein